MTFLWLFSSHFEQIIGYAAYQIEFLEVETECFFVKIFDDENQLLQFLQLRIGALVEDPLTGEYNVRKLIMYVLRPPDRGPVSSSKELIMASTYAT